MPIAPSSLVCKPNLSLDIETFPLGKRDKIAPGWENCPCFIAKDFTVENFVFCQKEANLVYLISGKDNF